MILYFSKFNISLIINSIINDLVRHRTVLHINIFK